MKQWIPYIGYYFTIKAPFEKSLIRTNFWSSMIWHGAWNAIPVYFVIKFVIETLMKL